MKYKKFQIAAILLFLLMLFPYIRLNVMAEDEPLVCIRAVQINDYQVVIEFSEPVKINYYGCKLRSLLCRPYDRQFVGASEIRGKSVSSVDGYRYLRRQYS